MGSLEDPLANRPVGCWRDFPCECEGCPEYVEDLDLRLELYAALAGCFGIFSRAPNRFRRCRRFNWSSRVESPVSR